VPPSARLHASQPSLAETLRARGLRLTAQRQLVLEAVYRLGHATPDQVHAEVARTAAGINITTVYRTLELLEELGLVTHTHLSHGAPTYHGVSEEQHVHLVCRTCGGVDDIPAGVLDGLAQTLEREKSFSVDRGHVALFGVCGQCGGED
jgi:Fur family ferric uptake transcriptional regulator